MSEPLPLDGVVHLVRPSGHSACDLAELRAGIEAASDASLFYHAYHPRLRHAYAPTLPPDDFSAWVNGVIQDRETAERVAFAVQTGGWSAADLRPALLAAIPAPGARPGHAYAAPPEGAFVFLEMDSVPVDLGLAAQDGEDLVAHLCGASVAVFFYHVLERPWFDPGGAGLASWALARGEPRLAEWIAEVPQEGRPLAESQRRLDGRWRRSHVMRRVAMAADMPEGVRQAKARSVVSGLVRRIVKEG